MSYNESMSIVSILIVYFVYFLVFLLICSFSVIGNWFIFKKAGREPWKALIPFYNSWVMAEFTMGHGAFMFLPMLPAVGSIAALYMQYKKCASFGKDIGFFIGYIFLFPVFHLMLAFDKSQYIGVTKNFWES